MQIASIGATFVGEFADGRLHKGTMFFQNVHTFRCTSYPWPPLPSTTHTPFPTPSHPCVLPLHFSRRAADMRASFCTTQCTAVAYFTIPCEVACCAFGEEPSAPVAAALCSRARVLLGVMPRIAGARRVTTAPFSTVRGRPGGLFNRPTFNRQPLFFFLFSNVAMRAANCKVQARAMATVGRALYFPCSLSFSFSVLIDRCADC